MTRYQKLLHIVNRCVQFDINDCAVWPSELANHKYPVISKGRRSYGANRIVCELIHGRAPADKSHAAHSCGNRRCVNPRHLRWANAKENAADKAIHGTHKRGSLCSNAILNEEIVRQIKRESSDGLNQTQLAIKYGVSRGAIHDIFRGKSWTHVGP